MADARTPQQGTPRTTEKAPEADSRLTELAPEAKSREREPVVMDPNPHRTATFREQGGGDTE